MCSKNGGSFSRTVTFRLTLRCAVIITFVSIVFFAVMYLALTRNLAIRMDEDLVSDANQMAAIYQAQGKEELGRQIEFEIDSEDTNRMFIRLMDSSGQVLLSTDMEMWDGIQALEAPVRPEENGDVFETVYMPRKGSHARIISRWISPEMILQIGCTLEEDEDLLRMYRRGSILAVLVLLVCGGVTGWHMGKNAMSGVERVRQTAVNIGKGDLLSRVPLGNEGKEINDLARAFNDMLERIQGVVSELREVTNHIAHDLRSPITRIRGMAETTMTGEQTIEEYREMAEIVVEESDRLVGMINVMLDIAMTEAGGRVAAREEIDIVRVAESACEIFQTIAEDRGLTLMVDCIQGPLVIRGNLSQLQRMISNLLDNACKFTPPGGSIRLTLQDTKTHAVITVADTGIGISDQDLPRIFEQFYRADRSRSTPGNGLGLSHVKAIVRAHGGEIQVESTPGKGSSFTVYLPIERDQQGVVQS